MPGFLIPMAGLALGALGRLINRRRTAQALASATGSATANMPSETSMATDAASGGKFANGPRGTGSTAPGGTAAISKPRTGTDIGVRAHKPGQGPNTQGSRGAFNQGVPQTIGTGEVGTGTLQSGQSTSSQGGENLHGRRAEILGNDSIARSRKKNRDQQAALSGAALV